MEGQGLPKRKEAGVANKKLREDKKKKSFEKKKEKKKNQIRMGLLLSNSVAKSRDFYFLFIYIFLFVPCFGSGMLHSNILQYFMILLNLNI